MKRNFRHIAYALFAVAGIAASCSEESLYDGGEGEGTICITPEVATDVSIIPVSRATGNESTSTTDESLLKKLNIVISTTKGNAIRYWNNASGIPWSNGAGSTIDFTLNSGSYILEGWTGDSIPASWTARYFKGKRPIEIKPGVRSGITLTCKIANTAVAVAYSDEIDNVLSDYTLTVTSASASLQFTGRDERTGYFMLPTKSHDLEWRLTGKRVDDGTTYMREGKISNAKASTLYNFNIMYEDPDISYGGAAITIKIDENEIVDEKYVKLRTAPNVWRINPNNNDEYLNIGARNALLGIKGDVGDVNLVARSSGRITSVRLKLKNLPEDIPSEVTLYGDGVNEEVIAKLAEAGISGEYIDDRENLVSQFPIKISSKLTDILDNGRYQFYISVSDEDYVISNTQDRNPKECKEVEFRLNITTEDVIALNPDDYPEKTVSLFEDEIILIGEINCEDATEVGFYYRNVGDETSWEECQYVNVVPESYAEGTIFTAKLSGLPTETTYEYIAVKNGVKQETTATISTGTAPQLPNAGFEEWQTSKAPYLIYASSGQMFWDSGNHGSSTLGKNVTTPASNLKRSGNYSIKLESQFVGMFGFGKFAAGNVFIGEYLKTVSTNGILGWGRPWTTRPRQLKGYVKYVPATVTDVDSNAPDIVKGQPDKGIIYIALLDDNKSAQGDSSYPNYPVVVRTSDAHLFNKDAQNVLAYGELVFDSATEGDELIEFTIDLDWKNLSKKPSYIMLTASASKGGDYFAGGRGSVMYLDDLELVY